jgi:hypothetical protein
MLKISTDFYQLFCKELASPCLCHMIHSRRLYVVILVLIVLQQHKTFSFTSSIFAGAPITLDFFLCIIKQKPFIILCKYLHRLLLLKAKLWLCKNLRVVEWVSELVSDSMRYTEPARAVVKNVQLYDVM